MKSKIKILIAREGLIIISLLLLAGISFFAEQYVNEQKRSYESNVQEIEPTLKVAVAAKATSKSKSSYIGPYEEANQKKPSFIDPFDEPSPEALATGGHKPRPSLDEILGKSTVSTTKYKVTDSTTGKSLTISGYPPPTDAELNEIFTASFGTPAPVPSGIYLRFPKNTNNEIIKQTLKRDFPKVQLNENWIIWDTPKGEYIAASYDDNGSKVFNNAFYKLNYSYAYIFFFIFAYPLYLLGRFISWAILTLRERRT